MLEMVLLLFLRYWRLGIILPPVPPTLKHPSAPLQDLLNILRRDQPDPGECEDLSKKDIIDGFLHNQWTRVKASPAFSKLCGVDFLVTQHFSLFWNQV